MIHLFEFLLLFFLLLLGHLFDVLDGDDQIILHQAAFLGKAFFKLAKCHGRHLVKHTISFCLYSLSLVLELTEDARVSHRCR